MLRLEKARVEIQKLKADILFNRANDLPCIDTLDCILTLLKKAKLEMSSLDLPGVNKIDTSGGPIPSLPDRPPVSF